MGDDPGSSGSDLPAVPISYPVPGLDDIASAYPLHLQHNPQQAYNTQFDMAQPQIPARAGPYNMNALANALPQNNYRQGPYNPSQMRYISTGSSPTMAGTGQHMPQYNGQPPINQMPNQAYYIQQQPQMPPYYNSPMSPSQSQGNMSPRPNMPYYGNQVMANHQGHPSVAYYYAQMGPFQPQGQPQHQGILGAYMAPGGGQHDPRLGAPQGGESVEGLPFSPTQQEVQQGEISPEDWHVMTTWVLTFCDAGSTDTRSNIVRGPPRKPRQSGMSMRTLTAMLPLLI